MAGGVQGPFAPQTLGGQPQVQVFTTNGSFGNFNNVYQVLANVNHLLGAAQLPQAFNLQSLSSYSCQPWPAVVYIQQQPAYHSPRIYQRPVVQYPATSHFYPAYPPPVPKPVYSRVAYPVQQLNTQVSVQKAYQHQTKVPEMVSFPAPVAVQYKIEDTIAQGAAQKRITEPVKYPELPELSSYDPGSTLESYQPFVAGSSGQTEKQETLEKEGLATKEKAPLATHREMLGKRPVIAKKSVVAPERIQQEPKPARQVDSSRVSIPLPQKKTDADGPQKPPPPPPPIPKEWKEKLEGGSPQPNEQQLKTETVAPPKPAQDVPKPPPLPPMGGFPKKSWNVKAKTPEISPQNVQTIERQQSAPARAEGIPFSAQDLQDAGKQLRSSKLPRSSSLDESRAKEHKPINLTHEDALKRAIDSRRKIIESQRQESEESNKASDDIDNEEDWEK